MRGPDPFRSRRTTKPKTLRIPLKPNLDTFLGTFGNVPAGDYATSAAIRRIAGLPG